MFYTSAQAIPTTKVPDLKLGTEYNSANSKVKLYTNLRSLVTELNLTYLARTNLALGSNLVLNPQAKNLDKYDFGATWSPASGAFVGLKHESVAKDTLQIGKLFLFFHHNATLAQTVGTEFTLDWQKRLLEARFGLTHKFNDDSSAKFKVNHHGYLDALLKHRINNNVTAVLTSGFSLKSVIAEQKTKSLPLGLSLDIKF